MKATVDQFDLDTRRIRTADGVSIAYEQIVTATGSTSDRSLVPGAREPACGIAELEETRCLSNEISKLARSRARILIVGGGLTGIETAAELAEAHASLDITLVSSEDPGRAFSRHARRHLERRLTDWKIRVVSGVRVTALESGEARLANGGRLAFDRTTSPLHFRAVLRCVRLGRKDALIQLLRGDESAAPFALTGPRAARVKEFICQTTVRSFDSERRGRTTMRPPGIPRCRGERRPRTIGRPPPSRRGMDR